MNGSCHYYAVGQSRPEHLFTDESLEEVNRIERRNFIGFLMGLVMWQAPQFPTYKMKHGMFVQPNADLDYNSLYPSICSEARIDLHRSDRYVEVNWEQRLLELKQKELQCLHVPRVKKTKIDIAQHKKVKCTNRIAKCKRNVLQQQPRKINNRRTRKFVFVKK